MAYQRTGFRRQVLADPTQLGPDVDVWARLRDGTPLVTSRKFGEGRIVLFHVTANAKWSNLPLSGLAAKLLDALQQPNETVRLEQVPLPERPPRDVHREVAAGLEVSLGVVKASLTRPARPEPDVTVDRLLDVIELILVRDDNSVA